MPTDEDLGLYKKFTVEHSEVATYGDDMFILDIDHDPFALPAARAWYAEQSVESFTEPKQSAYRITRTDNSLRHVSCIYHVLNFSRQYVRSLAAIKVYHDLCKGQYPELAADLWSKYIQPAEQGL